MYENKIQRNAVNEDEILRQRTMIKSLQESRRKFFKDLLNKLHVVLCLILHASTFYLYIFCLSSIVQRNPVPQIRSVQIVCTRATLKKHGKHRQMFVLYREMNRSFQEQIGCSVVSSKLQEYPGGVNVPCRNRVQEWRTAFIITCIYFGALFNEKCDQFRLIKKSSSRDKKNYNNVSLVC